MIDTIYIEFLTLTGEPIAAETDEAFSKRNPDRIRAELVQIAAICLKAAEKFG